jgi:hypothetical protein
VSRLICVTAALAFAAYALFDAPLRPVVFQVGRDALRPLVRSRLLPLRRTYP